MNNSITLRIPKVLLPMFTLAAIVILLAGCPMPDGGGGTPLSNVKAITAFSFAHPAVSGTIDENAKTVAVTVPYGTSVTALVAMFTTTGSSVEVGSTVQVSGVTANDFTSPVVYTVTAADGSTASYSVTVTVASSNAKSITAFSFQNLPATGAIDENAKTIAVTVPDGTNVTALVATFTTTGSSVKVGSTVQVSGVTANDFTSPVVYAVTAADDSTVCYAVTVTVALSSAKAITAFSFLSPPATGTIDENAKTIVIVVPYGTSMTALVATFATTGSSVRVGAAAQVSSVTANDFTNPVIYLVTAADGSTASYTVTVTPQTWQLVGTAGFSAGAVYDLALAIDTSGTPYVSYEDGGNGYKATVMQFTGGSWQTVGNAGFSGATVNFTSLAFDPMGTLSIAYGGGHAVVMKYANDLWQTLGTAASTTTAYCTSLAIDSTGTPYIAYEDWGNSYKATVMKYAAGSWRAVGGAGFSAAEAFYTSLAVDSTGTPYIAYEDYGNSYRVTVMKYANGSWQAVGSVGISAGEARFVSLALDATGTPYVAYVDRATSPYRATVIRYAGGSWQIVGASGLSAGDAMYTSLAMDSAGTPFVAYTDGACGNRATVMKFTGGSWQTVGGPGFSAGAATYTSLAIDSSGVPYVAYKDAGNANRASVMRFK